MKRPSKRFKALLGVGIILLLTFTLTDSAAAEAPPKHPSGKVPIVKKQVVETYGKLPLSFEANRGQTNAQVKFLSRGRGYTLFLTPGEAVLAVRKVHGKPSTRLQKAAVTPDQPPETTTTVLRMQLVGANPATRMVGLDALPGKSNYFIGKDPQNWHTDIPNYAKVQYQDIYPGVDLIYYGNQGQLEYDFVVTAGVDPNTIRLGFEGADKITLDKQGNLILHTTGGKVIQYAPVIYQEINGEKQTIPGQYMFKDNDKVSFQVGTYDRSIPLVIDPGLSYSTYLGGGGSENGQGIAVDSSGNAYVTGNTDSTNFPGTPLQSTFGGETDTFVTKLNAAGDALVYSTYLGGSSADSGFGIAVDSAGNAYVAGRTSSADFPTANAIQPDFGGGIFDAFVTKLNAAGDGLVYSTFLGGSTADRGFGIAVDSAGNAYVTGDTTSADFPTANAFQSGFGGVQDAFVTKLNAAGDGLVYSTYLGGGDVDEGFGIAVDADGNAYITGKTQSRNFPTTEGAFDERYNRGGDAFVTKLNDAGSALVYSTYLGGSGSDIGQGIAVHSSGNAYVTGRTDSTKFPTANAIQPDLSGLDDVFVTKLDPTNEPSKNGGKDGGGGPDCEKKPNHPKCL